jgi:hypothetical protein
LRDASTVVNRLRAVSSELTARRVYDAVVRRMWDVPHVVAWHAPSAASRRNQERLEHYRARHRGERCFIMGNGPSLARMDLSPLRDEITFGLNRIYLLIDRLGFEPTYFACVNELVLEQFAHEIGSLRMPKFLDWRGRGQFDATDPETVFVRTRLDFADSFAVDPRRGLFSGGTVTYVALQLAYFMGFREVNLIGVDHNFSDKGTPNRTETRHQARDENHFHPNYFPPGTRWQLPDLVRSELAYGLARRAFERDGRRVLDATVGGKCQIFEKVDFDAVVRRVR